MHYDLNIPYNTNHVELQQTLAFLQELGFNVIALNHSIIGKIPSEAASFIPEPLPYSAPAGLQILRRCTYHISDPNQVHRLSQLASAYDLFALRPTTEKALQQACRDLECDIISLDFSVRQGFVLHIKTLKSALERGIKFEICYGPGILNLDGGASRRNLIANATQLIRATRGRGLIISSQAKNALACRSPADIINLASTWGLQQERSFEAIGREARSVVMQATMKRRSFRGVIDVVDGDAKKISASPLPNDNQKTTSLGKRKAETVAEQADIELASSRPVSKREQKRLAKRARQEMVHVEDAGT